MKPTLVRGIFSLLSPAGSAGRLSVLLFHKIPTVADPVTKDEMDLARLERILDFLVEHANVLPLSEATVALKKGSLPRRAMALTFDDGYAEWLTNVSPALRKRNLPATFFVTTGQMGNSGHLWHERIVAAVRALPNSGVSLPYGFGNYADLSKIESRKFLVAELQERLKYAPLEQRTSAIELLEAQADSKLILPPAFDASSVRTLHSQGFEIGGHTINHPILNECTRSQARDEIGGCKEELEALIAGQVHSFAYPNGHPGEDFDAEHVAMVKSLGYKNAVTTAMGVATSASDVYQIPRFTPWGESEGTIAFQLGRNMRTAAKPLRTVDGIAGTSEASPTNVRCLLIASTFPPIHGGSAVVYQNICEKMPSGSIRVLSARKNYQNSREIEGWHENDAGATFPIDRIELLRPLLAPPPANILVSLARLIFQDVPLYAKALISASRLVRRHDINVICIGELVAGSWLGIALSKLFNCKLVLYVHGEEITTIGSGRLYANKRKQYLAAADKIVAVSSFTCDALTSQMDVKPESIVLIHNGVDTARFRPGAPDPALIARHNLAGKKVVLTVARLTPRKGIDMTIRAMSSVIRARDDVRYLIVGDGETRCELEQLIAAEGLGEIITLVGKVTDDELLRYLRTCDLFVMPNRTMPDGDTEGFGLVFREANACRKPVIGGRAGGVVEAVVDGKSGLLVDGTDPQQISDAILRVLSDPDLAERLSAYGLQLAQDNDTAAVARQFLHTCERLLREYTR
jgi:glycosyltransferase involved in cell wall biosynthesis/peptidoglycan/xylan/chitin deacetylase (PgdA/CDA1 family)